MHDHYETLQVHPRADQEAIQAAYERLCDRYNLERLDGAADELVELAQRKRVEIEQAYSVLSDQTARARYDTELARKAPAPAAMSTAITDQEPQLDYRPLPPARRQERDRRAAIQATVPPTSTSGRNVRQQRPLWLVPVLIIGILTIVIVGSSLALTAGVTTAPATSATPAPTFAGQQIAPLSEVVDEFDKLVAQARLITQQQPENVQAWVQYANALYDSVQVVRERDPQSELYRQRIPLWLEATMAYSRALELDPTNAVVRSDLGVSYCYYGGDSGDQQLVQQGIAQTNQALEQQPQDLRILLNGGVCLVQAEPPQTQQALDLWQQVVSASPESNEARQAQVLIQSYTNR